MFASAASQLRFVPTSGMRVIISANVQVYERDGVYQLYVNDMQPDGIGALYIAFEQLKERLSAEGLFDESLKKQLPEFPAKIGIVTSTEAAALQDMLNIISRRYPIAEIVIYPCLVQGANAPESICSALKRADSGENDIIIVGRGGGSLEDLMAFNSESVARAIFKCETPVISAVGHETDTTIADYAADLRAPTPSAAAELAAPDISVIMQAMDGTLERIRLDMLRRLNESSRSLEAKMELISALSPKSRLNNAEQRLDELSLRIRNAVRSRLDSAERSVNASAEVISALDPLGVLTRGYSMTSSDRGVISSAGQLSVGENITVRFADGSARASVTEILPLSGK